jgi:hypothetical protein
MRAGDVEFNDHNLADAYALARYGWEVADGV